MSTFRSQVITKKGEELVARALAQDRAIHWTKASIGDGVPGVEMTGLETLVSPKLDAVLIDSENLGAVSEIILKFSNENITEEFKVKELGIFGQLEGDTESVLYSYSTAIDYSVVPINSNPFELQWSLYTQVTDGEKLDIKIKPVLQMLNKETADLLYVPMARTINKKPLTENIVLGNEDINSYHGALPDMHLNTPYTVEELFALKEGYYNVIQSGGNYGLTKLGLSVNDIYGYGVLFVESQKAPARSYTYVPHGSDKNGSATTNRKISKICLYHDSTGDMSSKGWRLYSDDKCCRYDVGDYWRTESTANPAVKWPGTTWQKVEGKVLIGTSSSHALGTEGGAETVTLKRANLPNVKIGTEAHIHTDPPHTHDYSSGVGGNGDGGSLDRAMTTYKTSAASGGNTGAAAPQTEPLGSGEAINIMSPYRAVNVWRRTA